MGLPTSRDITINDGDPIPAWIINKLEDQVIGSKHPELKRGYVATRFAWSSGFTISNGAQINSTAAAAAYCGIDIPVGDRITTIKWGYIVGTGGQITMSLRRRLVDGSAADEVITPFSGTTVDNSGTTFETNTVTYNHVVADGYVYFLQINVTNNASNFFGAIVAHDNL
jgi:hypothetical protein